MNKLWPAFKRALLASRQSLRWIFVALLVVLPALAGVRIGLAVAVAIGASPANQKWAAGFVGVTFLLATLKEALDRLPAVFEYVKSGASDGFYKFVCFLFVASLTATVALRTATGDNSAERQTPLRAEAPFVFFVQPGHSATGTGGTTQAVTTLSFAVPFTDEAQRCALDGTCSTGLEVDQSSALFLQRLARGLSACAVDNQPVRVDVRGFSSSSRFASESNSDSLNVELANRRAAIIAALLRNFHSEYTRQANGGVIISPQQWNDYEAMRREQLRDRRGTTGEFVFERGLLSRRADVRISTAGDCNVSVSPPT